MQKLLGIILITTLVGCGTNKKEVIVEEIKRYKDSIRTYQSELTNLRLKETEANSIDIDKPGYREKLPSDSLLDLALITDLNINRFNRKIDSLELELKKY